MSDRFGVDLPGVLESSMVMGGLLMFGWCGTRREFNHGGGAGMWRGTVHSINWYNTLCSH